MNGSLMRIRGLKKSSLSALRRIVEVLRRSICGVTPTSLIVAGAPIVKIEFVNFKLCYDKGSALLH
jgi:hypothetical protein